MSDWKKLLAHEIHGLELAINRQRAALDQRDERDKLIVGMRQMIASEQTKLELLRQLLQHTDEPGYVHMILLGRLEQMERLHHQAALRDTGRGMHCDEWWYTQQYVDYLNDLLRRLRLNNNGHRRNGSG